MKKILNISLLLLLWVCVMVAGSRIGQAQSPTPILEKVISIQAQNQKLGVVLRQIEEKAGFTFSYNSEIINSDELVSISVSARSVREVLQELFKGKLLYKEKGTHLILTKAPPVVEKAPSAPVSVKISGYVVDSYSGDKIAYVSIYNSKTLHSVNSDEYGFYSFKIDKASFPLSLSYNKLNYRDTLVSISKNEAANVLLNIPLTPHLAVAQDTVITLVKDTSITFVKETKTDSLIPVSNPALLSERELIEQNVLDTIYRRFQVSFIPFAGSNHKLSGRVINAVSFNVLGGYNMGVSKFELGGLFNINRAYVRKAQIAGLFNYVHGNMQGVQIGGLFNIVLKQSSGLQIGGLGNIRIDTASGHQIGGLFNLAAKGIKGSQIGGLFNISGGNTGGAQIGGLFNISAGETGGMQLGGLFNYSHRNVNGAQVSGLFNIAGRDVKGMQLSGLINRARVVKGAQVTGIINIARRVDAAQVGLINIADTVRGIPVAFISVVRSGYLSFEFSSDESFYTNLTFRTGVRGFYNIFTGGLRFDDKEEPLWAAGYGIGSSPRLAKRWYLSIELTTQQLLNSVYKLNLNLLNRFYLGFEFLPVKRLAISAGGTINGMLSQTNYPEFTTTFSPGEPWFFKQKTYSNNLQLNMWWGARVGIKVLLGRGVKWENSKSQIPNSN